jgi:hypothetical protein
MTGGSLGIAKTVARSPLDAANAAAVRCLALNKRASDLAVQLLAGAMAQDAGIAKDQVRARLGARGACSVAAVRASMLPASTARKALLQRLEPTRGVRGLPNADDGAGGVPSALPGIPAAP